ncbi:MAG: hypothetical protein HYV63_03855 [Candidatus Schekmanbacteria bacterium]|nr:hypothetical protein [Candidatus Schekmanbacteria bacterium]
MKTEDGQHKCAPTGSQPPDQAAETAPVAAFIRAEDSRPPAAQPVAADTFEQSEADPFGLSRQLPDPAGFYSGRAGKAIPVQHFRAGALAALPRQEPKLRSG